MTYKGFGGKQKSHKKPKSVGLRELVEFVNAPKLTLAEWQRKMENKDGYGSVAAWFNKYVVIDPDAVTPVGDGTYIRGIRLRTSADTQPTIEEYLMEREQLKLDKDGFDSTNL